MTGPRPDTLGQVGGRSEKEKGRGMGTEGGKGTQNEEFRKQTL